MCIKLTEGQVPKFREYTNDYQQNFKANWDPEDKEVM